jgi:putative SOS response-associated peptidase YedK
MATSTATRYVLVMCGRFGFEDLTMYFERTFLAYLDEVADAVPQTVGPRPNIAPTEDVLALLTRRVGGTPRRRLEMMRWSLVPPWADSPRLPYATFNARVESVAEKATFRDPWKRGQRCLVPADRFLSRGCGRAHGPTSTSGGRHRAPHETVGGSMRRA